MDECKSKQGESYYADNNRVDLIRALKEIRAIAQLQCGNTDGAIRIVHIVDEACREE